MNSSTSAQSMDRSAERRQGRTSRLQADRCAGARRGNRTPPATARQHYLLFTLVLYPSPHPSRFRPAGALGVWYGAESVETACTELAYWRWRFLMESEGLRTSELIAEFSLFRAKVNGNPVDLSVEPWDARRADWTGDDYWACLALGEEDDDIGRAPRWALRDARSAPS